MYVSLRLLVIAQSRQALTPVMAALEGHQVMELSPLILNPGQLVLPEQRCPVNVIGKPSTLALARVRRALARQV